MSNEGGEDKPKRKGSTVFLDGSDEEGVAKRAKVDGNAAVVHSTLSLEEYSDRCLVVRGDTRAVMSELKSLGGRFNPKLKGGSGWIFQMRSRAAVEAFICSGVVAEASAPDSAAQSATVAVEEYSDKAVIVKGDTKPIKDKLKALGGRWNSGLVAWVFAKGKKAELEALLSKSEGDPATVEPTAATILKATTTEDKTTTAATGGEGDVAASNASAVALTSGNGMRVEKHSEKSIVVRGDTRNYKTELKELGGRWNGRLGGWVFQVKARAEVDALVESGVVQPTGIILNKTSKKKKRFQTNEFVDSDSDDE